jgi:hypothetical protein
MAHGYSYYYALPIQSEVAARTSRPGRSHGVICSIITETAGGTSQAVSLATFSIQFDMRTDDLL